MLIMKIKSVIGSIAVAGILCGLVAGCATEQQKEAKLQAKAKITRAEAEKTALARVPGGTIKEGGIEKGHGKLIWSFDITTPGTADITEVAVDALSGQIVAVDKETPSDEAKEKKGKQEKEEK
jgi:peptidase YpeB-like protein